jgi:hypothetical protein
MERIGIEEKFTCQLCSVKKDIRQYSMTHVLRHTRKGTECDLICSGCSSAQVHHMNKTSYTCFSCKEILPRMSFFATTQRCRDYTKWRCKSCHRRVYPPCVKGCGMDRPHEFTRFRVENMPFWTCAHCRTKSAPCTTCKQELPAADFDEHTLKMWRTLKKLSNVVCIACEGLCAQPYDHNNTAGIFKKGNKFTCQICSTEKDVRLFKTKDVIRYTRLSTECALVCLECLPVAKR